jgi:hypothetical protein
MQTASRSKTKRRGKHERTIPPMVSRDGRMYAPPPKQKVKKARRRVNVALRSKGQGAEVRLPAVPALSVGWRLMSGILAIAMAWGIYFCWSSPKFEVQDVEVRGLQSVSQEEIFSKLQIYGASVFTLDPRGLKEMMLDKFSALEDVVVDVSYPADVVITVTEREPVIAWEQAGIASWWVDRTGLRFEPLGPSDGLVVVNALAAPPPLPVNIDEVGEQEEKEPAQEEPQVKELLTPEMVDAILFLAAHAPENSVMVYDGDHGLGWADQDKNWTVYFGKKLDNLPLRLSTYETILADLTKKKWAPVYISVEYVYAPYYRMKP